MNRSGSNKKTACGTDMSARAAEMCKAPGSRAVAHGLSATSSGAATWRKLGRLLARAAPILVGLALMHAAPAPGHESEQYTLPAGREFADLGPYFSRIVHDAVVGAVDRTNADIAEAVAGSESRLPLGELQSSAYIAGRVWEQLFLAIPANELLDLQLASDAVVSQFPGLVTVYLPLRSIYNDPLLLIDLTKFVRTFFRAGSVNVGGTVIGTDKLIHFLNVGRIYHAKYETRRQRGLPVADATRSAIASTSRNPLFSEDGVLGMWTTGIRSNADLAADYAGLQFYRNLTEEVRIGRRSLPPMLVRDGEFWRVRIEPDSDFFTAFVTPHWNEALNPNRYVGYTRGRIRSLVQERCADALEWYRDERGHRMERARFEAIERELATYFGEDYEHESDRDPVSIAIVCFAASIAAPSTAPAPADATAAGGRPEADTLGRTELWWAARGGDVERLLAMLPQAAAIDTPDLDGETPLHAAVRAGSAEVVVALLSRGADANRAAAYGVTPLMLACSRGTTAMAAALLRAGANPNQRDLFGKTALFDAALRGHAALTALLLDHGADARLTDDAGNTALHFAARSGSAAVIDALLAHGADARVVNAIGASPEADARRRGHSTVAQRLRPQDAGPSERAPASARDEHSVAYGAAAPAEPGPRVQEPGPRVQ